MKRINLLLPVLVSLFAFASCHKDTAVHPNKGKDLALSATDLAQASSDNAFTFNLFKTVAAESTNGSNVFISPLSVSMAMGMTSNGANGQTLDAIRTTLGFNGFTQDEMNSYYNKLVTQLPELDPNTTLKIANSIWYDNHFSVLKPFLQTDSSYYQAKVKSLDFSSPASVNTINDWVSNQTDNKITRLLDGIPSSDVMYLINAIYFKSVWKSKFDPAKTQKLNFHKADNSAVQADFMGGRIQFNTYTYDDVSLIELPYSNDKYSMVIIMPFNGKTINDIIPTLNNAWPNWMSNLRPQTADLLFPKFKFSYDVTLNNALTTLGMGVAFSPLTADFTRINPGGGLSISQVKHKAYVAVDENGTTAAAATSVGIQLTDALIPSIIDHPFIFAIREMKTGLILFTGTVNDPTQSGL